VIIKDRTKQANIRTSMVIPVEQLLRWRDPHCPDGELLHEEFYCVNNDVDFWFDTDEEQTFH
jgi:hypothetical protein